MWSLKNLLLFISCVFLLFLGIPLRIEPADDAEFRAYLQKYNKTYQNETVYHRRFDAFKNSLETINRLNALRTTQSSALYGLTKFSDMPRDEFVETHLQVDYSERTKFRKIINLRAKRASNDPHKDKLNEINLNNLLEDNTDPVKLMHLNKRNLRSERDVAEDPVKSDNLRVPDELNLNARTKSNNINFNSNIFLSKLEPATVPDTKQIDNLISAGSDDSNAKGKVNMDFLSLFRINQNPLRTVQSVDLTSLPKKVDWRKNGVITGVNNQNACGACWAFSAVEIIESMSAIKGNALVKLSTQQLIDCAGNSNDGCNGGDICSALEWMQEENVALQLESEYPLHLRNERCHVNASRDGIRIKDYVCDTFIGDENYIVYTLAKRGPVAVAINAILWQNYVGGVIHFHCNDHPLLLNHEVQIVGYDLEADIPHYIVRNSWGEHFGDSGYLYIAIGKNMCGLANEVTFVDVQ